MAVAAIRELKPSMLMPASIKRKSCYQRQLLEWLDHMMDTEARGVNNAIVIFR